jgi:flagellar biosynthetic protein FliQ
MCKAQVEAMTPEAVVGLGQQALQVTALIAAPMLLAALIVGALIGMFQAATQINEMTLSFIPKLLALVVVLVVASNSHFGADWLE